MPGNIYEFTDLSMDVSSSCLSEVAECVLESLFLHRRLSSTTPIESVVTSLDYPYTGIKIDNNEAKTTKEGIAEAISTPILNRPTGSTIHFEVQFQQKAPGFFWGSTIGVWERWVFSFHVIPCEEKEMRESLSQLLWKITEHAQVNVDSQHLQFKTTKPQKKEFTHKIIVTKNGELSK